MSRIDELASICLTGRLRGFAARPTPDDVERAMGNEYLDVWDKKRRFLRRDYGIVEFHFFRDDAWRCRTVGIQLHRVQNSPHPPSGPELPLLGEGTGRVVWADLARAIQAANGSIPTADSVQGYLRYHFPQAGVEVFVEVPEDCPDDSDDVWSIVITYGDSGVMLAP
ncbi:hypothetical protein Rhe02_69610 [Rhizocola hellebori]|uniref:Uncharacterized protein n=1 Tax=Rhizocola hellebori TaxID=1392758 RepID=A0A8J3QDR3_9ACTN|nr:hypothetical protein Rhe02_69610 [Rhizocola hellebori]